MEGSRGLIAGVFVSFDELFVCRALFAHRIARAIRSLHSERLHHRIINAGAARWRTGLRARGHLS